MVLADQVANGHGYSYPGVDGGVTAYYPPGYLLLAALMWGIGLLPGDVPPSCRAVGQCAAVGGHDPAGLRPGAAPGQPGGRPGGGGGLRRVAQPRIHSGVILTETLFLFLLVGMFLVALATPEVARRPAGGAWRPWACCSASPGSCDPCRSSSRCSRCWHGGRTAWPGPCGPRRSWAWRWAVIVPWTIRNVVQMDSPVLLSANFGDNFAVGNNPEATGGYGLPDTAGASIPASVPSSRPTASR